MEIVASTISLAVNDIGASRRFFSTHLGFVAGMVADDFVYLHRAEIGLGIALRQDRTTPAVGLVVSFTVRDIEGYADRLRTAGVAITVPLRVERWGERLLEVRDPSGITVQLVEWARVRPAGHGDGVGDSDSVSVYTRE